MIKSFKCKKTEELFSYKSVKDFRNIERVARRKLYMLNAANDLMDLRSPPNNRLEKLKGDRNEQYSIRINDQWRVCFKWDEYNVREVEIVDYH